MENPAIKLERLKRVSVVGTSCSGKSTFAKNLASILNVKHIELDAINFLPDWVERPKDEFLSLVEKAADGDDWVFDGNYTRTREIVWGRATAIVWLDYSFPRTFYQAINRTTRRVFDGTEVCGGNRETFRQAFMSRDSILLWVLKTYFKKRRSYTEILRGERLSDKEIFIFRHLQQAKEFLRQIEQIKN